MTVDDEVLGWIREAVEGANSWESVRSALRAHDRVGEDPRMRSFVFAFSYAFHERFTSARERAGGPFGALSAGEGWRFPPALSDISDVDVQSWRYALDAIDHPIVAARLGDLLWQRKSQPDPHLSAGLACDGLMTIAVDPSWHVLRRVDCLSRALELARATHDKARQQTVAKGLIEIAEGDLGTSHWAPGVPLRALRPLVELPPTERPHELDDLLKRVGEKYGASPNIVDSVADLRSKLVSASEGLELRRHQVRRWREESTRGDTLLRMFHLEQALELARNYGLRQEADELRTELGQIHPNELGLKRIVAELELPQEEVDRFLHSIQDADTWEDALRMLATQIPPGGSPQELDAQIDQAMNDYPLQFLFPRVLMGPDNATAIFRATTPEQHKRLASASQRAQLVSVWGLLCGRALQLIGARHDRPDREALADFFATEFIESEVAERIARAIELFWDEQYDESAHVLVPRLERAIRELARKLGIPIVREPRPDKDVGRVELLGTLLRQLEGVFPDRELHAYLLNLLTDPLGLNLRNSIAHGLHRTVSLIDAASLIEAALLLSALSLKPVDVPPEPPPGAALA